MADPYVEFPVDNLVNCHFKDRNTAGSCKTTPPPAKLCANTYGGGVIFTPTASAPFGPFAAAAPWAGTFNTVGENGPVKPNNQPGLWGGLLNPYVDTSGTLISETLSAPSVGFLPASLFLDAGAMSFTDRFLLFLPPPAPRESWIVPMAEGEVCYLFPTKTGRTISIDDQPVAEIVARYFLIPVVAASYTIKCEWQSSFDPGDEIGFDLIAPIHNAKSAFAKVTTPKVPTFGPFSRRAGSWEYTYQYKWNVWFGMGIPGADNFLTRVVNDTTKTDVSYGGPRFVYSHARRAGQAWQTDDNSELGSQAIIGPGDWFKWQVTSACVNEADACCLPPSPSDSWVVNSPDADAGLTKGPIV